MTQDADPYSFLEDPAERQWLNNVSPADVRDNAHRIYEFMADNGISPDSFTRELAFTKAAEALGVDYDVLYDAWLNETPVSPGAARTAADTVPHCAEAGLPGQDPGAHTYRLTIDTTLLDGDQYGAVLEVLMDSIAKASQEIAADGIPCRLLLSDTSTIDNTVLDLDRLDEGAAE